MTFKQIFLEQLEDLPYDNGKQTIALYPGGFKPPTRGHFAAMEYLLQDANQGIIFIGSKPRNNINSAQSADIWEIYTNHFSKPVDIIVPTTSPVTAVYEYVDNHPDINFVLGAGAKGNGSNNETETAKRTDIQRYKDFTNVNKYPLVRIVEIPLQEEGISGTIVRQKIINKDPNAVDYFVPENLSEKEKGLIRDILNI
jgi:hypothetical protein